MRNFCYKIDWVSLQLEGRLKKYVQPRGRAWDSYKKQTGMLVVSLRCVNFGFWSRLGCSGQSANILSLQRSRLGFHEETQNYAKRNRSQIFFFLLFFLFQAVSFRGQNLLKPRPDWSPLGVKFKISDEHPRLFHIGVPPPGLLPTHL